MTFLTRVLSSCADCLVLQGPSACLAGAPQPASSVNHKESSTSESSPPTPQPNWHKPWQPQQQAQQQQQQRSLLDEPTSSLVSAQSQASLDSMSGSGSVTPAAGSTQQSQRSYAEAVHSGPRVSIGAGPPGLVRLRRTASSGKEQQGYGAQGWESDADETWASLEPQIRKGERGGMAKRVQQFADFISNPIGFLFGRHNGAGDVT